MMMRSPRHFLKAERGVALIEFALIFPFLFFLLFGGIEVVKLIYVQQKEEKAGYVMADVVTRYLPATNPAAAGQISESELNVNVFPIFGRIMTEFKDPTKQAVILTSITKSGGVKRINWQIASPNPSSTDNTMSTCDTFGTCVISIVNGRVPGAINGSVVNTPTAFPTPEETILATMPDGDNMIVSEVFFMYTPTFQTLLQGMSSLGGATSINFFLTPRMYVKRTYFTPRNGELKYLPPTFPAP